MNSESLNESTSVNSTSIQKEREKMEDTLNEGIPDNIINKQEEALIQNIGKMMTCMKNQTWRIDNSNWNPKMYLDYSILPSDRVKDFEAFACFAWGTVLTKQMGLMKGKEKEWNIIKNSIKEVMLNNHPSLKCMFIQ